jgi:GDP-4-dehydro-6-deoxy-D-mannose reductase
MDNEMRALITGINGFVGKHLEIFLRGKADVYGTSRINRNEKHIFQVDLLSESKIIELLEEIKPTHIFHLAGLSNVKDSWRHKAEFFKGNVISTVNLLEAVRKTDTTIKVITIGSSEEYGRVSGKLDKVTEKTEINPISPYGISKCSVSMLMKLYTNSYGMNIIHVRPFNHIGPGQNLGFVTTDFAYQLAQINRGISKDKTMKIGNLQSIRDFTDVRDIVEAYYDLACYGEPGEIYNVCTGKGICIQEILDILIGFSKEKINLVVEPGRMRASDIPKLVGDADKIFKSTGWIPKRKLKDTLKDIYVEWLTSV